MIEALLAGLFGLILGSFLNVCVYRMPRDISVAKPARSFCPSCEHTIAWYDNIPVLSYVLLKGRCRQCHAGIPLRYPVVEFTTGCLFFAFVLLLGPTWQAAKYCAFSAIQVALIAMDLEERILADEFTLGGILLGVLFAALAPLRETILGLLVPYDWPPRLLSIVEAAFAAAFLSGILWGIGALYQRIRGREGLGLGDVKMIGMVAAFLGLGSALLTLMVGSTLGTIVGLTYIAMAKKEASTYQLPFGSFLGVAALAVAFWDALTGT